MRRGITVLFACLAIIVWSGCSTEESTTGAIKVKTTGLSAGQGFSVAVYQDDFSEPDFQALGITANGFYSVTTDAETTYTSALISQQPTSQTCTVNNAYLGDIDTGSTIANVVCSSTTYGISGTVTGMASGTSFKLAINQDHEVTITENGAFEVDADFAEGSTYTATFSDVPDDQYCTISAPTGTMSADVSLTVTCSPAHVLFISFDNDEDGDFGGRAYADQACEDFITNNPNTINYTCSGGVAAFISAGAEDEIRDFPTTYGLNEDFIVYSQHPRTPLRMRTPWVYNKLADNWSDFLDGTWDTFADIGTFWTGSTEDGALGDNCNNWSSNNSLVNGHLGNSTNVDDWSRSGPICANKEYIACLCLNSGGPYTLSGTLSGLGAGTLSLTLNDTEETLSLTADGAFSFEAELDNTEAYTVAISSEPDYQDCTLTNGSGTIAGANVDNISVSCSATSNFLFANSAAIAANFGDRTASDALCDSARDASYSTLPCTGGIHAFISYSATDEVADFPTLYGVDESLPILDATNGDTKIADTWADLTDGTIDAGLTVSWWSGTFIDSTSAGVASAFDCTDFTSTSASDDVIVGRAGSTGDFWAGVSDAMCNETHRLMCLCHQ